VRRPPLGKRRGDQAGEARDGMQERMSATAGQIDAVLEAVAA
jgi:hypothetical protein